VASNGRLVRCLLGFVIVCVYLVNQYGLWGQFGGEIWVSLFANLDHFSLVLTSPACPEPPLLLLISINIYNYTSLIIVGGRDAEKVKAVHVALGSPAHVGTLVGDPSSSTTMALVTKLTKVLIATAGPFLLYGAATLEACVETRTHYCDITGEVAFVRQSIDKHQDAAKSKGIALVHCCGMDSVPADLGVFLAVNELKRRGYDQCWQAKIFVECDLLSTYRLFLVIALSLF